MKINLKNGKGISKRTALSLVIHAREHVFGDCRWDRMGSWAIYPWEANLWADLCFAEQKVRRAA
jgi:hypothetical protein